VILIIPPRARTSEQRPAPAIAAAQLVHIRGRAIWALQEIARKILDAVNETPVSCNFDRCRNRTCRNRDFARTTSLGTLRKCFVRHGNWNAVGPQVSWLERLGVDVILLRAFTGDFLDHNSKWIGSRRSFFLPVKVSGVSSGGKFVAGLKAAFREGKLEFHGQLAC
jgi:hypothetical protein